MTKPGADVVGWNPHSLFPGFISLILTTLQITYEFSPIFWLRKLTLRQTGGSSPPDELEAGHGLERWVQTPNLTLLLPSGGADPGTHSPRGRLPHGGDRLGASGSSLLPPNRPWTFLSLPSGRDAPVIENTGH